MGIENITARILQEAKEEALNVQQAAEKEKAQMQKNAEEKASEIKEEMSEKGQQDAKILKARRHSVAELEARKMRLALKQQVIGETFVEAMEQLTSMDKKEYLSFLLKELEVYKEEGGIVSLNTRDYEVLKEELTEAFRGSRLILGEEKADIRGGFILKQGKVFVNASLEKILEAEKKQITAQVADILFG